LRFQNYYSPGRLIRERKLSIFHSFGAFFPETRRFKRVLSLTDYSPLVSEMVFENRGFHSKWISMLRKFNAIICPSELSAKMIIDHLPEKAGDIRVILPGVDIDSNLTIDEKKTRSIMGKYSINGAYFLFVGRIAPGRNIQNLIKAYIKYWQRSQTVPSLVMLSETDDDFGRKLLKDTELLRSKGKFAITGRVTEEDLHYLYFSARALIYPVATDVYSPQIIEAMAMGVPVICSGEGFGAEIDTGAARFIIPYEPDDICSAIEAVESNPEYRSQLIENARIFARKYNWESTARQILDLYNELIDKNV